MLGLFKGKNKGNLLHSPCNGKVVPITEVPDSTFADKILGDGFAVIPSEGKVYAPADGSVHRKYPPDFSQNTLKILFLRFRSFSAVQET